ncbi:hypothetical protein K438DRAFT_1860116, partial [Mycena galopus ATCC 62051]
GTNVTAHHCGCRVASIVPPPVPTTLFSCAPYATSRRMITANKPTAPCPSPRPQSRSRTNELGIMFPRVHDLSVLPYHV